MTVEAGSSEFKRATDVVVIGGGVIGLACAWRAASSGLEVTVVDAGPERPGASEVAAGMLAPVGEASWGEGRLLRLNLASAGLWPGFAEELERAAEMPVPYRRSGSMHVALDRDEAVELRSRYELQQQAIGEVSWSLPASARRLEPGLPVSMAGAIHLAEEAEVDPRATLAALRVACDRAGVQQITDLAGVDAEDGAVRAVRLSQGETIDSKQVVIAAGAWSGLGLEEIPIRPVAGETVRLRDVGQGLPCDRIIVGERVYIVPRDSGEVVLGATVEERGFDTRVRAGGVHELLREAYRLLPEIAEMEFAEACAGLRPGTPDNAPIMGFGRTEGLIFATGHYRNGILLAPITADAVASLLLGEEPLEDLDGLGVERFDSSVRRIGAVG